MVMTAPKREQSGAVRLLFERVERFPRLAIGIDDMDVLGNPAALALAVAEFKALVPVHRRVAVLHPWT